MIVPHLPNYKSPNLPSPGKIQRKTAPSPLKAIPSRYLAVVDVLDPLDHAIALEGFISKLKDYNTNVKSNSRNDNDDASANDYNVDPNEFPFLGCSLITVDGQRSDPLIMNDAIQGVENSKGRSPSLSTLIERTKGSSGRSGSAEDALVQVCLKQMMETQEKQRKRIEVLRLEKEVQHEVGQEGKESMIQSMQLLPHPQNQLERMMKRLEIISAITANQTSNIFFNQQLMLLKSHLNHYRGALLQGRLKMLMLLEKNKFQVKIHTILIS